MSQRDLNSRLRRRQAGTNATITSVTIIRERYRLEYRCGIRPVDARNAIRVKRYLERNFFRIVHTALAALENHHSLLC